MDDGPGGFTEAGLCTTQLEAWGAFLTDYGTYREIWRGATPRATLDSWGCDERVRARELLMGAPNQASGRIRIFQLSGVAQEEIRAATGAWDSGGIFDLDVRVHDLKQLASALECNGWSGVSRPIDWQFGQLQVREWLATGPDAVVLALVQRLAPPLEGFANPCGFSHVFNSSQVVADMDRAVEFYEALEFRQVVNHAGPLLGQGGEVLGLSPEAAPETAVDLVILQPQGVLDGSVELVRIHGPAGRDVSARAQPVNLGLNLLRFPVGNLQRYASRLVKRDIRVIEGSWRRTRLQPAGNVESFAVRTPDGAWLEFYQPI
jgi:catechol 2,3-dioxygenase-like lactoylglutathione lyase family enzyme